MTLPLGRPARVGVVGLGRIYDLHARGYRGNEDVEIVALCDPDPARLAERGAEFPAAQPCTDLDDLVELELDSVDVLVPTPLHCELVCKLLRAGLHVNMQKPFANTLAEA